MSQETDSSASTAAPRVRLLPQYLYSDPSHGRSAPGARTARTRAFAVLPLLIIAVGLGLWLVQFLANRSLRNDEAHLASSLLERSYAELLQPLDYGQVAPFGFLWAQRLAIDLFGTSEYALRLLPFLAGCAALFLFWAVARRLLSPAGALFALALFATTPLLIFFTVDNKQYAFDVVVALLLLLLALRIVQQGATMRRALRLGVVGAVGVWFSHPAVFVMAGLALGLSVQPLLAREWQRLRLLALTYALWALGALPAILLAWRQGLSPESLAYQQLYWQLTRGFLPLPPTTRADLLWFPRTMRDTFSTDLLAFHFHWLAFLLFLVGAVWLWRRQREVLLFLLLPMAAALGASALQRYPFQGRLLLFLVPAFLLLIAAGTVEAVRWLPRGRVWLSGALAVALLLPWSYFYLFGTRFPFYYEEMRPVVQYVQAHRAEGDKLFIHWGAAPAFPYNADRYGISPADYEIAAGSALRPPDWESLRGQLERYQGRGRTWVIFSQLWLRHTVADQARVLEYLDSVGTRLDQFTHTHVAAYLYDL